MTLAIETRDLTRSFGGSIALDGLTLEVEQGEVLALLGPNGAGKTTTVRLLNGVLKPERGVARVLGLDPAVDGDEVRRHTGVLTENAGLDERLTARENLLFTARVRGIGRAASEKKADELLERFGMADKASLMVQGFSTGQRKRLALARALLHDPAVLFLDEPTSGLDPEGVRGLRDTVSRLNSEFGMTIFMNTHLLSEVTKTCTSIGILRNGRLVHRDSMAATLDAFPGNDSLEAVYFELESTPVR